MDEHAPRPVQHVPVQRQQMALPGREDPGPPQARQAPPGRAIVLRHHRLVAEPVAALDGQRLHEVVQHRVVQQDDAGPAQRLPVDMGAVQAVPDLVQVRQAVQRTSAGGIPAR